MHKTAKGQDIFTLVLKNMARTHVEMQKNYMLKNGIWRMERLANIAEDADSGLSNFCLGHLNELAFRPRKILFPKPRLWSCDHAKEYVRIDAARHS